MALIAAAAGPVTVPATAHAEASEEKTAQAKVLWQEANSHYAVGEYAQAAEKYQAAYKLRPDAALLYNAAQSYRLSGNNEKALLLYKNFVMFYPNAKNVPNVQQQIVKLQEAIAAQEKAKTQPPTATEPTPGAGTGVAAGVAAPAPAPPAPSAPEPTATRAAGVPAAPPSAADASTSMTLTASPTHDSPTDEPIYKKWWLWTIVGVVVAGAAVGTAVALSGSKTAWSTGPDVGPGAKGTP